MQQSQRASFNPALEYAIEMANRDGLPVLVAFGLMDDYPDANLRHYRFMLEGLRDVAVALAERRIKFVVRRGAPNRVAAALAEEAALVVCDRGYLRHQKAWRAELARRALCAVVEVEGDVVVPLEVASGQSRNLGAHAPAQACSGSGTSICARSRTLPCIESALDLRFDGVVDLSDLEGVLGSLPARSLRRAGRSLSRAARLRRAGACSSSSPPGSMAMPTRAASPRRSSARCSAPICISARSRRSRSRSRCATSSKPPMPTAGPISRS